VKFQIEKHAIAARDEALDHRGSVAREQPAADFEAADMPAKLVGKRVRGVRGVDVKGYQYLIHR
jgi:hypothetical protein